MKNADNNASGWFGGNHAAERIKCSECDAHGGQPCVVTVEMILTGTAPGMPVRGLHAARIRMALATANGGH